MKERFISNGDGTITDNETGLIWQQETLDRKFTWQQAVDYCKALDLAGDTDWRLPTIKELKSIVNTEKRDPTTDPVFQCFSSYYWSFTSNNYDPSLVWIVHFYYGNNNDHYAHKSYSYYVRAVRTEGEKNAGCKMNAEDLIEKITSLKCGNIPVIVRSENVIADILDVYIDHDHTDDSPFLSIDLCDET